MSFELKEIKRFPGKFRVSSYNAKFKVAIV